MGLIKAAVGAIGSTLHDQWKEAIRCIIIASRSISELMLLPWVV